jgi:hypothetical protein
MGCAKENALAAVGHGFFAGFSIVGAGKIQ